VRRGEENKLAQDLIVTMWRKLGAKITIEVSPSVFTFYKKDKILSLETYLYLNEREGKHIVAAVGQPPANSEPSIRIDLFSRERALPGTIRRIECLEAFMKYAMAELYNHKTFFRPRVCFKNSESLSPLLLGYQWPVLKLAAESAGASIVEFEGYDWGKPQ